jgi:hypothetical protein
MRVNHWMKSSMLLPGLCLAAIPILAQQQQQNPPQQQADDPVADAARKAREQQKAAPKPKRVYTDDDIKPRTPDPAPSDSAKGGDTNGQAPSGGAGAPADAQGAGSAGAGSATGADAEKTWRKRFADQRDKIAAAEKELDILQREADKAQLQYYNDPQKALMEQNTRKDINDKNAKIEAKKQDIANLKQQIEDMEDELRKSGGDPGWAR